MKLHLVTAGQPKLPYAKAGWQEYYTRLARHHQLRVTRLADKHAYQAAPFLQAAGNAYKIALAIQGTQLSSLQLARFLETRAQEGREVCYMVGGPEGLPQAVIEAADLQWSFSLLTFPHDLAMVILVESLYRASSINAGLPYHK